MESSDSGSVCSLNGNWTLSFCVNLNRSNGTRSPTSAEAPPFSTRYREPASAAVISRDFFRIRSRSASTSRVSDRAIPTRFSSSSSNVACVALSLLPWALGAHLRGDFLIPGIEKKAIEPQRQGAPAVREYSERTYLRHVKCAPANTGNVLKPKRARHFPAQCGERASNQ